MHRKKYTKEFKLRVVREAIEVGNGCAVARRYEIHPTMVSRWIRHYKTEGDTAFDRGRGRTSTDAEYKLRQTEQENDQLKRLLGEKDLEIAILRDLVKKGTHL